MCKFKLKKVENDGWSINHIIGFGFDLVVEETGYTIWFTFLLFLRSLTKHSSHLKKIEQPHELLSENVHSMNLTLQLWSCSPRCFFGQLTVALDTKAIEP